MEYNTQLNDILQNAKSNDERLFEFFKHIVADMQYFSKRVHSTEVNADFIDKVLDEILHSEQFTEQVKDIAGECNFLTEDDAGSFASSDDLEDLGNTIDDKVLDATYKMRTDLGDLQYDFNELSSRVESLHTKVDKIIDGLNSLANIDN
jgi:hypothetical protein